MPVCSQQRCGVVACIANHGAHTNLLNRRRYIFHNICSRSNKYSVGEFQYRRACTHSQGFQRRPRSRSDCGNRSWRSRGGHNRTPCGIPLVAPKTKAAAAACCSPSRHKHSAGALDEQSTARCSQRGQTQHDDRGRFHPRIVRRASDIRSQLREEIIRPRGLERCAIPVQPAESPATEIRSASESLLSKDGAGSSHAVRSFQIPARAARIWTTVSSWRRRGRGRSRSRSGFFDTTEQHHLPRHLRTRISSV